MLQNPPIQASLIPKFSVCGTPGLPVIGGTEGEGRGKEKGLHHDCRGDGRPCRKLIYGTPLRACAKNEKKRGLTTIYCRCSIALQS